MHEILDIIKIEDITRMEKESLEFCKESLYKEDYDTEWINFNELVEIVSNSVINGDKYLNEDIFHTQHGLRHHLRVQIYSYILMKKLNYNEDSIRLMNYICSIHDTQRKNDYKDHEHGLLAYKKFIENSNLFSNDTKETLKEVLETHDSKIEETDNLLLMILKCADALDRFRLKNLKGWINFDRIPKSSLEELMKIRNETKKIVMLCRNFTLMTERYRIENEDDNDYDVIMRNIYLLKREK